VSTSNVPVPVSRSRKRRVEGSRLGSLITSPLRGIMDEIEERTARIPTRLNEYGFDPFGFDPGVARISMVPMALVYRYYLRVQTRGVERIPPGRVLLIANHAGNTFAWDGAMVANAVFLEGEPPRMVRGMGEYFLSTIPFFNVMMQRLGSVVGTPENCVQLLENGEAIMAFPEGQRGFVKTFDQRYQLQRFGLGFMRLALETQTPIIPVGIVGSEEQQPGFANLEGLGRTLGFPSLPLTITQPWFGPLGAAFALPVKYHIHFGEPLEFDGDANDEDAIIREKVDVVQASVADLLARGREERRSIFF
jgi:1-acyl-sn-glycerol-3-phosphate acyltransferase